MKVINEAIAVAQYSQEDERERTIFQKYKEFNEHLFWIVEQKQYQNYISSPHSSLDTLGRRASTLKEAFKAKEQEVCKNFEQILTNDKDYDLHFMDENDLFDKINKKAEDSIPQFKRGNKFALGQKIPAFVKPFSKQEMISGEFSAKHSSVLRLLTKWAGYMEDLSLIHI